MLSADDLDAVVLDVPHHTGDDEAWEERGSQSSRKVRVWKMPFWKRRTLVRQRRALEARQVAEDGAIEARLLGEGGTVEA
jgi:hypothetical protein